MWFLLFFFRQLSHLGFWSEISILYIVSRISFYLKNHLFLIGQIRIICLLKWNLFQIEFCLIWIKFYFGKIIPNGSVFGYINWINEISFELIPFNVFYQKFWIVIIVVWLPYFFVHFFYIIWITIILTIGIIFLYVFALIMLLRIHKFSNWQIIFLLINPFKINVWRWFIVFLRNIIVVIFDLIASWFILVFSDIIIIWFI